MITRRKRKTKVVEETVTDAEAETEIETERGATSDIKAEGEMDVRGAKVEGCTGARLAEARLDGTMAAEEDDEENTTELRVKKKDNQMRKKVSLWKRTTGQAMKTMTPDPLLQEVGARKVPRGAVKGQNDKTKVQLKEKNQRRRWLNLSIAGLSSSESSTRMRSSQGSTVEVKKE